MQAPVGAPLHAHEVHAAERSVGIREEAGANPAVGSTWGNVVRAGAGCAPLMIRVRTSGVLPATLRPWPSGKGTCLPSRVGRFDSDRTLHSRWGSSSRGTPVLYTGCCGCKSRAQLHFVRAKPRSEAPARHAGRSRGGTDRAYHFMGRGQGSTWDSHFRVAGSVTPSVHHSHGVRARAQPGLAVQV